MPIAEVLARILVELGVLGALVGFVSNRWSIRYAAGLQAAHDREMALLKSHMDVQVGVTKSQFDAEFAAVSLIWEQVHAVRGAYLRACLRSARSGTGEPSDDAEREAWLLGRVNELIVARNQFVALVYRHQPFYAPELYQGFEKLIDAIDGTHRRILRDAWTSEWFAANDEMTDRFCAAVDELEQMVRRRFESLRLQGGEPVTGVQQGVRP